MLFFKLLLHLSSSASLVAQMVKNLPAVQETWIRSLGLEDALEEEMAAQYCHFQEILQYFCLENPMDRGARQPTVHGVERV